MKIVEIKAHNAGHRIRWSPRDIAKLRNADIDYLSLKVFGHDLFSGSPDTTHRHHDVKSGHS